MARKGGPSGASGRRILVVDDSRDVLEATRALLEREGHSVSCADGARDGLDLLRREDFDLLLVDYFMPGMTGEEMVAELRTFDPLLQVVLVTGYASERPARETLSRLDIQGYCDKSDGPQELLLWTDVGLKSALQVRDLEASRQGLQSILEMTPHLHRIQPLDLLLAEIVERTSDLLRDLVRFRAGARPLPGNDRRPDVLLALSQEGGELSLRCGSGRHAGAPGRLPPEVREILERSMGDGTVHRQDGLAAVPLRVGESPLGALLLEGLPAPFARQDELLLVFANQAAVAIQNALFYQNTTLDGQTGVYTHKFWEHLSHRELRSAWRFGQPVSLVRLRLEGEEGASPREEAVRELGRILRGSTRSSDISGRLSWSEFLVLLPRTAQAGTRVFLQRLRSLFEASEAGLQVRAGSATLEARDPDSEVRAFLPQEWFDRAFSSFLQSSRTPEGQELSWPDAPEGSTPPSSASIFSIH